MLLTLISTVEKVNKMDFDHIKLNHNEFSGSLGDIGIFLPLALSLISLNGLNPCSVFLSAGVLYIASGLYFKHPVPVQPLKALAVISLATHASVDVISAAAIVMGAFLFFVYFAADVILIWLGKIFTKSIIRGIQFGVGLMLVKKGVDCLKLREFLFHGNAIVINVGKYVLPLGLIIGVASVLFIVRFSGSKKVPTSLIIIMAGLVLGVSFAQDNFMALTQPASMPTIGFPGIENFIPAITLLVIPQIPLTVGNALFASADTAKLYFGDGAKKTTPKSLSLSLGIANTAIGMIGGMPLCHGAGGLTAHYKFGSRTTGSNLIIGTLFIVIAISSLYFPVSFLYLIPASTLGSLLIYTGIEHAMFIQDISEDNKALFVALTIGTIAFAAKNLFLACIIGIVVERVRK